MAALSVRCCTSEKSAEDYDVKSFSDNSFRRKKGRNVQGMKCDIKFFYYLLTYLLHGAESLLRSHLVEQLIKFPVFYGTRKFITVLTSARHLPLS